MQEREIVIAGWECLLSGNSSAVNGYVEFSTFLFLPHRISSCVSYTIDARPW